MNIPSNHALQRADAILAKHPIPQNPYMRCLCDGAMERDVFVRTQRQFFFAVRFFSRPMAALTARMPDSQSRRMLIHNLAEEHGLEDECQFEPAMAHDRTFIKFLETLGVTPVETISTTEGPQVQSFNLALLGACMSESPAFAFSTLGMIEYMFAEISAIIGSAVVQRGWIAPDELVHYKLHAEIDKRHAAEFFESVDAKEDAAISAGIIFGHHIFDGLYRALLPSS